MADRPPAPIYRSQGNSLFRTDAGNTIVSRGQDVPYDVNGAPTGAAVADGDYGDIVVSAGVWNFDPAVVTAFARTILDDPDAGTVRATIGAAPLASPVFTGTPAAPTAGVGTNTTQIATTAFVAAAVAALVNSSPSTLDTLKELADALGDDPNFATTVTTSLSGKQPLDSDLTAIAALTTTAYGRGLLTLADAAALTAGVNVFTRTLKGLVPASGGTSGTANFLREDGAWAAPATGASFRGAMVTKTATESAANYSTGTAVGWDSEVYDTDSIHDTVTNNTRLAVPAGVTKVRVGGTLRLVSVTGNTAILAYITKNGGALYPGIPLQSFQVGTIAPNLNLSSGPLPVVGGTDYFEIVLQAVDTSIDIHSTSNFWLEVVA